MTFPRGLLSGRTKGEHTENWFAPTEVESQAPGMKFHRLKSPRKPLPMLHALHSKKSP